VFTLFRQTACKRRGKFYDKNAASVLGVGAHQRSKQNTILDQNMHRLFDVLQIIRANIYEQWAKWSRVLAVKLGDLLFNYVISLHL